MDPIDIKFIFIFFLLIIFFIYGLTISEIIDYIFPDHNEDLPDYRIAIEIIGEIGLAYLIYFTFQKYIDQIINTFFLRISRKPPGYLHQILLIAFSTGIYKHLQKSTQKINHLKEKFIKW